MDPIEVGLGGVAQEELAATGVLTGVGHGQGAVLMFAAVDFAGNHVARTAGAGHALGAFAGVGAAALGHEAINHAVEGQAVIEALIGQLDEIGHGGGGIGIEEIDLEGACLGLHQGLGHGCSANTSSMGFALIQAWCRRARADLRFGRTVPTPFPPP